MAGSWRPDGWRERERRQATVLPRALQAAKQAMRAGERNTARLIGMVKGRIRQAPAVRIEYVAIANAKTLEPVSKVRGRVVVLLAARVGTTRLIDNILRARQIRGSCGFNKVVEGAECRSHL